jgi:hypothetical protein
VVLEVVVVVVVVVVEDMKFRLLVPIHSCYILC